MTNSRTPFIAGNWKMNLDHMQASNLVQTVGLDLKDNKHDMDAIEVAVFPPATHLRSVQLVIQAEQLDLKYGGQDLSPAADGAYTGDIGGNMLKKLGCEYVLVGHSERRQYHHETDDIVNAKSVQALASGLKPVICVGEGEEDRKSGKYVDVILAQVTGAFKNISADDAATCVVAYEPVWAIGTGAVATPQDAQEVCAAIRAHLASLYSADLADGVRVLYGGSVKAANVGGLLAEEDIDGALVGGASLDPDQFVSICGG